MEQDNSKFQMAGYRFSSEEELLRARAEAKRISLLESKLDYDNIDSVAMVFEKSIRNQVFVTPIGYMYLSKLQNILQLNDRPEGMLPVPVAPLDAAWLNQEVAPEEEGVEDNETASSEEGVQEETEAESLTGLPMRELVRAEDWKRRYQKEKANGEKIYQKMRLLRMANFLMVIVLVLLFWITINSDNTNVLNYKKQITNEYATWEEELSEREAAVREKEKELNLQSPD